MMNRVGVNDRRVGKTLHCFNTGVALTDAIDDVLHIAQNAPQHGQAEDAAPAFGAIKRRLDKIEYLIDVRAECTDSDYEIRDGVAGIRSALRDAYRAHGDYDPIEVQRAALAMKKYAPGPASGGVRQIRLR